MRIPSHTSPSTAVRTEVRPGVWLDARLAVWLQPERLLVVADLHWGYAASHRARGNLLPWWGDDELEQRLRSLVDDYQPAEMIWLGDVVHAAEGSARVEAFLRTAAVPITHVAGNHDRRWRLAGAATATRGNYFFHHGDKAQLRPSHCLEIIGHHHPAVSWGDGAGSKIETARIGGHRRATRVAGIFTLGRGDAVDFNSRRGRNTVGGRTPANLRASAIESRS